MAQPPRGLTDSERELLRQLHDAGVRYMLVGMAAALVQGARGATEDVDLWIEDLADPRVAEAARRAGGSLISGFGLTHQLEQALVVAAEDDDAE
jgi:predicted nucleotidyltransferase